MAGNPDAIHGPSYEEGVIWEEQGSDPSTALRQQYVTGKGLVIYEDGVARAVGEGRAAVWQPPVDERDVNSPPGSPTAGYRVLVGDSPTGDFVGHAGELAQWDGSQWVFGVPKQGTVIFVRDESEPYKQTSSSAPWAWSRMNVLPSASEVGEILFSWDGVTFERAKPIVSDQGFALTSNAGDMVVVETT